MNFRPKDLLTYATELKKGHIGILPFDTLYGLTSTLNKQALERISTLKGRDKQKSFIIIVSSWNQASTFAHIPNDLITKGPTTYILKKKLEFHHSIGFPHPTVAVRCPDYTPLTMLLNMIEEPIISTSVNISGTPELTSLSMLDDIIKQTIDFNCDMYPPLYNQASTIIDITGSSPKTIRQGVSR